MIKLKIFTNNIYTSLYKKYFIAFNKNHTHYHILSSLLLIFYTFKNSIIRLFFS